MQYPVSSTAFDPPPPQSCVPSAVKRFAIWRRVEDAARGVSSRHHGWSGSESDEIEDGDGDRWAERVAQRRESLARKRWTVSAPPRSRLRSEALESSISSLAESIASASASVASDMSGSQTELSPCRPARAATCCHGWQNDPTFLLPGVPPVPVLLNIGLSIAWTSLEHALARGCVFGLAALRRADAVANRVCARVCEARSRAPSLGKHRSALKYLVGAGLGVLVAASASDLGWIRVLAVGVGVGAAATGSLQALGLV